MRWRCWRNRKDEAPPARLTPKTCAGSLIDGHQGEIFMAQLSLEHGLEVLAGRARAVRVALWLYMALSCAAMADWGGVLALGIDQEADIDHPLVLAASFMGAGYALAMLASIVCVSLWIYRAHANLFAAGFEGLEFTPGWSVGWFFVPIAMLFKPFQAMRELWNASHMQSDSYAASADRSLTVWWSFWIVGNVIENVSLRIGGFTGSIGMLDLLGYAIHVVTAWCLLRIVDAVTEAQSSQMGAAHAFI